VKVAIIGAGIVGVSTAFELSRAGHDVCVFERHASPAEDASFATGAIHNAALSSRWLLTRGWRAKLPHPDVSLTWSLLDIIKHGQGPWLMSRATHLKREHRNPQWQSSLRKLGMLSSTGLQKLISHHGLEFERSTGIIALLRTAEAATLAQHLIEQWRSDGLHATLWSEAELRQHEPALNPDTSVFGAVWLPDALTGNCRQVARLLAERAVQHGAKFYFGQTVQNIELDGAGGYLTASATDESQQFDRIVVCTNLDGGLLKSLVKLPLQTASGCTISANIKEHINAPQSAIWDVAHQHTITRIGRRIRVAGHLSLTPPKETPPTQSELAGLYQSLQDWYPGAATISQGVQSWRGTVALTPDGWPLIGATSHPALWLNMAHGAHGWSLAQGAAITLTEILSGRLPSCDISAASPLRFTIR
jgi:D-amino-acid dehydrogenase